MGNETNFRLHLYLGHACHLLVLMIPTILMSRSIDISTILFAIGIVATGYLESVSVVSRFDPGETTDCDPIAILMAKVVGVTILLLFWLSQIEHSVHPLGSGLESRIMTLVGVAVMVCGASLRIVSIRTLKYRFLTDIRAHEERVCCGIYAWMRHPSELGILWITLGATMILNAIYVMCLTSVLLFPIYLWRIRREEVAWMRCALSDRSLARVDLPDSIETHNGSNPLTSPPSGFTQS